MTPEEKAVRMARQRRLDHSTRVPAIRYEVHRRWAHIPTGSEVWIAHDNQGTCERRGDDWCFGTYGSRSTGGEGAQAYLIEKATEEARRRWEEFIAEMQARGRVFG